MNVSDEVQLKSGGPVMTVVALRDGGSVECGWFDGDSYKTAVFPQVALVPYE